MVFNPENLRLARKKRGITKSKLAQSVGVDVRSVSAWESGDTTPSEDNLSLLSVKLSLPLHFFSEHQEEMPEPEQVSFRALSKLSATKRDMALATSSFAFSFSNWIEGNFELPKFDVPDLRDIGDPEEAAQILRNEWLQGNQPISNMIHLLESKGIRVFSLSLDMLEVDAYCTWRGDTPFVFLNTKKSNARRRFDAAHELAHLVLHRHGNYSGRETEIEADRFASAFLMPRDGVIPTKPRLVDLNNAIQSKREWGVSVAAYVVRMHKLGQISDWQYRSLFKQISQRGYRKSEPFDHHKEQSKLLEVVLKELRNDGMSLEVLSENLNLSEIDLAELCFDLAMVGVPSSRKYHSSSPKSRNHISVAVDNT